MSWLGLALGVGLALAGLAGGAAGEAEETVFAAALHHNGYAAAHGTPERFMHMVAAKDYLRLQRVGTMTSSNLSKKRTDLAMVSTSSYSLYGSTEGLGAFDFALNLGNPARNYSLILDTGSNNIWVYTDPCKNCPTKEFKPDGVRKVQYYKPWESLRSGQVSCLSLICYNIQVLYGGLVGIEIGNSILSTPPIGCPAGSLACRYFYLYGDSSGFNATLYHDAVRMEIAPGISNSTTRTTKIAFGAADSMIGALGGTYPNGSARPPVVADGLAGFAPNPSSLPNQLARKGVTRNSFTLCMGGPTLSDKGHDYTKSGGGFVTFGNSNLDSSFQTVNTTYWTTLKYFWGVPASDLYVAGKRVQSRRADWTVNSYAAGLNGPPMEQVNFLGTVFDSGTTLNYFTEHIYHAFNAAIASHVKKSKVLKRLSVAYATTTFALEVCWNVTAGHRFKSIRDVIPIFPEVKVVFENGAFMRWNAAHYLYGGFGDIRAFCIGVGNAGPPLESLQIIGNIGLRQYQLVFDNARNTVSWKARDCSVGSAS